jgi:hypothetical protein
MSLKGELIGVILENLELEDYHFFGEKAKRNKRLYRTFLTLSDR